LTLNYRPYLPAIVSGAVLIFAFPFFDFSLLAFVALVPFLVSLWQMSGRQAFKAGMAMGVVYFYGTLYWIYYSVYHYGGVPLVAALAVVLLLVLYLSVFTGLFALLFAKKLRSSSLPALFLAPVFWVVLEYARTYLLSGFPWASIGYTQHESLRVIQMADITGVYGVSFFVVAVNGAIADLFIIRKRREAMPLFHLYPTVVSYVLLAGLAAAVLLYGGWRLSEERPGKELEASIVQGNIRQDLKWNERYQNRVLDTYETLSETAELQDDPDLVIWPESALPFYFGLDKERTAAFRRYVSSLGTPLLTGAVTVKGASSSYELGNSAVLLTPKGEVAYSYDKIHLVPFGEYVPLRRMLFFVDKLAHGIGEYVPGEQYTLGKLPGDGEFSTLICYEIIFPGLVRKFFKDGEGDFMVTISNDAWFGKTPGPYQHFSMAVFRAVENRKPVIRATNTGVSGFIDSNGRVLERTGIFERNVLTAAVRTDRTVSFYSRFGDLFAYLLILGTAILLMDIRRK
jgi:apolipoprotein N-acyltransferase